MKKRNEIPQRTAELLVDQATEGLNDVQQQELDALLGADLETLQEEFLQTAALVQLGMHARQSRAQNSMPDRLRQKIAAAAASKLG